MAALLGRGRVILQIEEHPRRPVATLAPVSEDSLPAAPRLSSPPGAEDKTAGAALVRLAGPFYGIVTLFAVGYAIFDRIASEAEVKGPFLGLALPSLGLALAGIGVGIVIVAVVHAGRRVLLSIERAARAMARILGPLSRKQALYLALVSAAGEELLFRGALWEHLDLLGTTLLFGLVRVVPRRDLWGYPLFALGAGLLFGLLRDSSGSVFPPMLAHFVINAVNLAWLGANHARLVQEDARARPAGDE